LKPEVLRVRDEYRVILGALRERRGSRQTLASSMFGPYGGLSSTTLRAPVISPL